jgi:hypothetical protein
VFVIRSVNLSIKIYIFYEMISNFIKKFGNGVRLNHYNSTGIHVSSVLSVF